MSNEGPKTTTPSQGENRVENKEGGKFPDLVIYTTTFYGNDPVSAVREKLALKLFENANKLRVKCVVVDGGSNPDFLAAARQFPNIEVIIDPSLGMGQSRRVALKKAITKEEAAFFLWVEPEKSDLIDEASLGKMITGLRDQKTDIVVPKRESMETLPEFQAWIENRANKRAMKISGVSEDEVKEIWDIWFGPKMFNRDGAQYFLNYQGKLDKWDAVLKPVFDAYKAGKRVSSVGVDYKYDITQKQNEENDREMKKKRVTQYMTILSELSDEFWIKKGK